jgi:hypothetical protein
VCGELSAIALKKYHLCFGSPNVYSDLPGGGILCIGGNGKSDDFGIRYCNGSSPKRPRTAATATTRSPSNAGGNSGGYKASQSNAGVVSKWHVPLQALNF